MTTSRDRTVIIIGAGIAGLAAGCYLQMNGYKTRIFEMHTLPGGLCTSWNRAGYTIDGCMHWTVGTGPGMSMYEAWRELGIVQGHKFISHEVYVRVEGPNGKVLDLHVDPDRLEPHMKELAPQDSRVIEEFTGALRALKGFDISVTKAPELEGPIDKLRAGLSYLPYLRVLLKWRSVSVQAFAARFQNPFLREAFVTIAGGFSEFPMFGLLMPLVWLGAGTAGYRLGGSLELAKTIEQRYTSLGGEATYGARVEKILVENDRAVGVRLADGTEHHAGTVVSAADGRSTIFDMLDGRYIDARLQSFYRDRRIFPPLVYIGLGVARVFDDVPDLVSGMYIPPARPLTIGSRNYDMINVHPYDFDPSLAPEGCTALTATLMTDYDYWEKLYEDRAAYEAEKERIAAEVVAALEKRFPGIAAQIEVRDMATPMTWVRYTGNWRGSFEGWYLGMDTFNTRIGRTLPGLSDFYMVGQWVEPGGGLSAAAYTGRHVTQLVCRRDGKRFTTSIP